MAIYRADQAVVTFAAETAQGAYIESASVGSGSNLTDGVNGTVSPGDRTLTTNTAVTVSSGANNRCLVIVGDDSATADQAPKGPKEIRKVVSGYGTTTVTVDAPFAFAHADEARVETKLIANEGTADALVASTNGRYITQLPGVYETVDVPDPEQAFEPRYILGGLTNRNFYEMYKGQETMAGSIAGMVMLNGYPLRFPIGKIQTLPVHDVGLDGTTGSNVVGWHATNATQLAWSLNGATSVGDVIVRVDKAGANAALARGTYLCFGFAAADNANEAAIIAKCDGGFDQFTSSTKYEIRQVVSNHTGAADYAIRLNAPLHFAHGDNDMIAAVGNTTTDRTLDGNGAFIHRIIESTTLDSMSWNVAVPDSDGSNIWQRRYIGGKVGSMTLSAEEGGLVTAGWDGVQFLDMVHNVKAHYDLPGGAGSDGIMPRYSVMQEIAGTQVGVQTQDTSTTGESISYVRPSTQPYYFSEGTVTMFGTGTASDSRITLARLRNFSLSVANGEEPRYYIQRQYEGRRTPREIFEGNREYTMSATIAMPDVTNPGTASTASTAVDLWRELLLAGDYRANSQSGFGVQLRFDRDVPSASGSSLDYILITIPGDGTAGDGGNEQGAFIKSAPHNIGTDNPIQADADIQFRNLKIEMRDGEPMYP